MGIMPGAVCLFHHWQDMHYPNGYVLTAQPAPYVKASRVRKNTIRVYHVPGVASEVFVHLQAK